MNPADAIAATRELINEHGLDGWYVELTEAKTEFGACWPNRRRITLSAPLVELHDEAEVLDTIRHEVAHALLAGIHHGHGPQWRAMARKLGARPEMYVTTGRSLPKKWTLTCRECGIEVGQRHRRTRGLIHRKCRTPITWCSDDDPTGSTFTRPSQDVTT